MRRSCQQKPEPDLHPARGFFCVMAPFSVVRSAGSCLRAISGYFIFIFRRYQFCQLLGIAGSGKIVNVRNSFAKRPIIQYIQRGTLPRLFMSAPAPGTWLSASWLCNAAGNAVQKTENYGRFHEAKGLIRSPEFGKKTERVAGFFFPFCCAQSISRSFQ